MDNDEKVRRMDRKVDKFRMRIKESSDRDVLDNVFDNQTLMALYGLSKKGYIDALGGTVSTGKEANVFHAISNNEEIGEIAVKIYLVSTANFNTMREYILGDPRFLGIKQSKKDIIFAWAKKEFKNLKRAEDAGVNVPKPHIVTRNILLMEFIGKDAIPTPRLKDVKLSVDEAQHVFDRVLESMVLLYSGAKLVHADLSEYNILLDVGNMEPVIIDMGQSVTSDHFNAEVYLKRDITNIARYFRKLGVPVNEEEMMVTITKDKEESN